MGRVSLLDTGKGLAHKDLHIARFEVGKGIKTLYTLCICIILCILCIILCILCIILCLLCILCIILCLLCIILWQRRARCKMIKTSIARFKVGKGEPPVIWVEEGGGDDKVGGGGGGGGDDRHLHHGVSDVQGRDASC